MARLTKNIATEKDADEMRETKDRLFVNRKEVKSLFTVMQWKGNRLRVESRFASGELVVDDNKLDIDLELSFLGRIMRKKIDSTINENLKLLTSGDSSKEQHTP